MDRTSAKLVLILKEDYRLACHRGREAKVREVDDLAGGRLLRKSDRR
jgi:hypothetical protein